MSYETAVAPDLVELLGRAWVLPGAVEGVCFNREGGAAAFFGAGRMAIVPVADPERAETRMRRAADTGRSTILPRKGAVRPAAEVSGVAGPVVPWGAKSFLTGDGRGGLVTVTPRGQAVPLGVRLEGSVTALARDPASAAVAVGGPAGVVVLPEDAQAPPLRLDVGPGVTALAYDAEGLRLACGSADGVVVWAEGKVALRIGLDAAPACLSWSTDGAFLAVGFAEPGFAMIRLADGHVDVNRDYPTPVASFGWSAVAGAFATSGAFRAIAWTLGPDGTTDPIDAGRSGLVVVERVAASPDRPLLAAGYASGLVCLNRLGGRDEMLLRASGGAVTALAWSADGAHLAFGDEAGQAVLLSFPPELFK